METIEALQSTKLSKAFLEDYFSITPGNLCRSILRPDNDPWTGDNTGKRGLTKLRKHGTMLELSYSVDLELGSVLLNFHSPESRKLFGVQDILLESAMTSYGERGYFTCEGCDARVNKLFLRRNRWRCQKCQNLIWRVKNYDRRSGVGILGYYLDRGLKLEEKREAVKRISYAGKWTRKALALIELAAKWSLPTNLAPERAKARNV